MVARRVDEPPRLLGKANTDPQYPAARRSPAHGAINGRGLRGAAREQGVVVREAEVRARARLKPSRTDMTADEARIDIARANAALHRALMRLKVKGHAR